MTDIRPRDKTLTAITHMDVDTGEAVLSEARSDLRNAAAYIRPYIPTPPPGVTLLDWRRAIIRARYAAALARALAKGNAA